MSKKFMQAHPDRQEIIAGAVGAVARYLETRGIVINEESEWRIAEVIASEVEPDPV